MAIYHCSVKPISRSSGRSSVGSSAYRSGTVLKNERDGITHDYSRKSGIDYTEIMVCENAPAEYQNREKLWNAVEKIEKAIDSRLAREIEVALPVELNRQEQVNMVREYVKENFVNEGMCADIAIHDKKDGNPHAHIMLTVRPIDKDGKWENKTEKVYLCKDKQGHEVGFTSTEFKNVSYEWEKQYKYKSPKGKTQYLTTSEANTNLKYKEYERISKDPKSEKFGRENLKIAKWNSVNTVEAWRESWASSINREFEKKNINERVDHRSFERQGIDKLSTKHLGVKVNQMEKRGIETDRGNINREIIISNRQVHEINSQIRHLNVEHFEVRTDIQIQTIHNNIQNMKAIIPNANEKQLESVIKTMPTFDKYMDELKKENFKEKTTITVKDKKYSYKEYHIAKYENGVSQLNKMVEERKDYLLSSDNKKLDQVKAHEKAEGVTVKGIEMKETTQIDLQSVAQGLEKDRQEYIRVVSNINESNKLENRPKVTYQYSSRANKIQDVLKNISNLDQIIQKAQAEKESLGVFKPKEKKILQETIDRGQENKQKQIVALKELGVHDMSKASDLINKLNSQHEAEQQKVDDFNKSKKALEQRAAQLKSSYIEKKGSLTDEQKIKVSEYQKDYRQADDLQSQYMNLERTRAEIKADRELEPKERVNVKTRDHERSR